MPIIPRTGNALVDSLSEETRRAIHEAATPLTLRVRDTVYEKGGKVDYVYFPIDGFISNVLTMKTGDEIEVGIVGREGMAGFPLILTGASSANNLYTQIEGEALRVPKAAMTEIIGNQTTERSLFLRYAEATVNAVSQFAACNRLHAVQERFARWICMAHDRVLSDEIPLTQEFLALMLGVRRAGVSIAASTYQEAGLLQYSRGRIVVLDRPQLQARSCECYDAVEDRFTELMGFSIRKYRSV